MKGLTAPGNFTPFIAGPAGTTTIDGVRGAIGQLNDLSFSADAMILNPGEFTDMELIKDEQGRYIIGNPNCGSSVVLNVMVKHSTSGRFQARSRTQALSINPL